MVFALSSLQEPQPDTGDGAKKRRIIHKATTPVNHVPPASSLSSSSMTRTSGAGVFENEDFIPMFL